MSDQLDRIDLTQREMVRLLKSMAVTISRMHKRLAAVEAVVKQLAEDEADNSADWWKDGDVSGDGD